MARKTLNVEAIDAVLKREAESQTLISYSLAFLSCDILGTCKGVGHCAIGALLVAAGYPESILLNEDHPSELKSGTETARLLRRVYGLLPAHTAAIENINDNAKTPEQRYESVMGLVGFISFAQQNGIPFDEPPFKPGLIRAYNTGDFDN